MKYESLARKNEKLKTENSTLTTRITKCNHPTSSPGEHDPHVRE
jgi:hypothetical protein